MFARVYELRDSMFAAAILRAVLLGVPLLVLAGYVPNLPGSEYAGIPAGLLIGLPMRALIRGNRDVQIVLLTAAIAGACVAVVQLGMWWFMRNPPILIAVGIETIAFAAGICAERLRAFDIGHAQDIARHEMKDLQRWTEELQAKPPPGRIIGGARVRCTGCDEMVDATTTELVDGRGLLCDACR